MAACGRTQQLVDGQHEAAYAVHGRTAYPAGLWPASFSRRLTAVEQDNLSDVFACCFASPGRAARCSGRQAVKSEGAGRPA